MTASLRNPASSFLKFLARTLFTLLIATSLPAQESARNIILFIGDGMGPAQVKAANFYHGGPLSFESLPIRGEVTTYSTSAVTDSAAAATAIATGFKVDNGVVSLATPGDGGELETLLEMFAKRGKKTALLTTAYLTHATPAGFGAHETNRGNYAQIGADYLNQTRPNILFGGGGNGLDAGSAATAGYVVATDTAGFVNLDPSADHLAGLFGTAYLPYEEDYLANPAAYPYPHLSEMVAKALDALEEHSQGFFLMVEAGRIDHACHSNLLPEAVHEALELGNAVQVALDWMAARSDTLMIVTADHETGGLTVTDTSGTTGSYPMVSWSTTGHTAANVPVYATGLNANQVPILMDNTEFVRLCTLENTSQPIIYRVSVSDLTDTSATIVWSTDVASDSLVEYRAAGSSTWLPVYDALSATTHNLPVTSLTPGATYEYRVSSNDGTVTNSSAVYPLVTLSDPGPPDPEAWVTLVMEGSTWKYLDNGSDQGSAWTAPGFDDTAWAYGPAELGYGDNNEATTVSYGGDSSNKYPTTYFRHTFNVLNPAAYGALSLRLLRDDGAVVYLNGIEVHRVNMPAGTISFDTFAAGAADYPWDNPVLLPNTLLAGNNVLAVEIHQAAGTSSDISFDLELTAAAPEAVSIIKGPWLQNVTDSSIVVMWETDAPTASRVDYGIGDADEFQATDETPVTIHEITLTGLLPNTPYIYTVSSENTHSAEVSFTTAPVPGADDPFRFAVYSDSQANPADHGAVIDAMLMHDPLPRFVLHAGDLVDQGQVYSEWESTFFTPAAGMIARAPVFHALGNHDYSGTGQMWFFDFFNLPDNGTGLGFEEWYAFTYGNTRLLCLDTNVDFTPGSDQYTWLVSELASTESQSASWRIVFFHHPPYANLPTVEVQSHLVPLFHQYGVHLVFSGHDHNYRHVERLDPQSGSTISYIVTGGGGATLKDLGTLVSDPTLTEIAAEKVLHHCLLDVTPSTLTLHAYRNDGSVIDSLVLILQIDSTPPEISEITTSATETTATITWTTDEVADSLVQFRIGTEDPWLFKADASFTTAHRLDLTGLDPATIYQFQITSLNTSALSSTSSISTFTTDAPNAAPVAFSQAVTLDEDAPTAITLAGSDPNTGDTLTFSITTAPAHGTLTGIAPGLTYTPTEHFNGSDSFQFSVSDGVLTSPPATVTINVTAVNDPPTAPTDLTATAGDGQVGLSWQPATDPDGPSITYSIDRDGSQIATGLIGTSYTDATAINGTTYSYVVSATDGTTSSGSAPVSATPQAPDPNAYVTANPTLSAGVLNGDFSSLKPLHEGTQTLTEVRAARAGMLDAQYVLQTVADLTLIDKLTLHMTYSLAADDTPWRLLSWNGSAWTALTDLAEGTQTLAITLDRATSIKADGTIQIAIRDGGDLNKESFDSLVLDTLYVEVAIGQPNHPPTANPGSLALAEDTTIAIALTGSDPEGDTLSYTITVPPTHGSIEDLIYTPDKDFNGADSFEFVASDGRSSSAPATVGITVTAVNDPPLAAPQSLTSEPNTPVLITLDGSDVDGGSLSYRTTTPAHGTLGDLTGNQITYTPDLDYVGNDSFAYTVTDEQGATATETITITVTAASGPPVIHVAGIGMSLVKVGKDWRCTAAVDVVDQAGQPVSGATVTGDWTYEGTAIGSASGPTDASGRILLSSALVTKVKGSAFTFTVTGVTRPGADYDEGANATTVGTNTF